jgi:hypothetical protein
MLPPETSAKAEAENSIMNRVTSTNRRVFIIKNLPDNKMSESAICRVVAYINYIANFGK